MSTDKKDWDNIPSLKLEMDDEYSERLKAKEGRRHARTGITSLKKVLHGEIQSLPIRVATAQKGVFDGQILDLSKSGVKIHVPKLLEKGELTKVGFILNKTSVIVKAVTRWVDKVDDGCKVGMEFQDLPPNIQELIEGKTAFTGRD